MPNKENGNRLTVLIRIIAISFASFHLYTGIFGILVPSLQRPIHLVFSGVLAFLIYKPSKKAASTYWKWIDGLLACLALLTFGYFVWRHDALSEWMVFVTPFGNEEFFFGIVSTILLLEATRRASGLPLMLVGVFFLIYSWVGGYLPGALQHAGFSWRDLMESLFFSLDGVFGIPIGVSATYIVIFIIFGSFYEKAGGGQAIIDLGKIIAGHTRGGPAKIAVLTSALFGSISGSGVANVYATGTFTIPMMKRFGFKPSFAGAVEACASTGGQIMPPVMGAAAFVMADLTGNIYLNIITAALIPAILFFFSVFLMVDFEAARQGIKGIPRKELPAVREVLRQLHLFIPLVVLILTLVWGKSPIFAGILAVASTVLVSWFNPENRLTPKRILDALETAGRRTVMIGMGTALCGVVIGVVTLTGVGLNFVGLVISLSGGITIFSLLLVMMATIILGMGVPTTVAYIIVVSVVVPALRELGFETLPAHMFAFYFAVISLITPPVAVSSLAASEIAGAEFFKTGLNACKVGVISYVVPFVFIYYPVLLMEGRASEIIFAFTSALFGVWILSAGVYGWLMANINIMERLLLITGGMLLLKPGLHSDLIGLIPGLFVIILAFKKRQHQK
jgi:TRAP transporter 4TM/12TM fusion protein